MYNVISSVAVFYVYLMDIIVESVDAKYTGWLCSLLQLEQFTVLLMTHAQCDIPSIVRMRKTEAINHC